MLAPHRIGSRIGGQCRSIIGCIRPRIRPPWSRAAQRQLHLSFRRQAREQAPEAEEEPLEELSEARHLIITDSFLPPDLALDLRGVFDSRFKDPRSISNESPRPVYESLLDSLIEFGETKLGCAGISPIWMSYYIDGCLQELHTDPYHGPFAFVLSLTNWDERSFRGGETFILKSNVLDYWLTSFDSSKGLEQSDLVDLVEPSFNRLTVFDPRFPHGVKRVSGTHDPSLPTG